MASCHPRFRIEYMLQTIFNQQSNIKTIHPPLKQPLTIRKAFFKSYPYRSAGVSPAQNDQKVRSYYQLSIHHHLLATYDVNASWQTFNRTSHKLTLKIVDRSINYAIFHLFIN